MQTSRTTVCKWDAIAYEFITDYQNEYPLLPVAIALKRKKYTSRNILHDTEVPLSEFQVWVLSQLVALAKLLYREARVIKYISDNLDSFSKSRFEARLSVVSHKSA